MVISIALFGFALSGTISKYSGEPQAEDARFILVHAPQFVQLARLIFRNHTLGFCFSQSEFLWIILDCRWNRSNQIYLLLAYLLLALPFFFSGLVTAVAYTNYPDKTGLVYFASMAGSAGGALAPATLLPFWGEESLIIMAALAPLIFVPLTASIASLKKMIGFKYLRLTGWTVVSFGVGLVAFSLFLYNSHGRSLIQIRPSPYKALSQILQFPNTRIVATHAGIRSRTDSVETPYIRFAPGLSLKYRASLPFQDPIFEDADNQFVLYDTASPLKIQFAQHTLAYAGYHLQSSPERVLLILSNGGLAVACALSSGSRDITIAHQNPHIAGKIRDHYNLSVVNQNPRGFLARSGNKYDMIQIENWGTSVAGAAALNQEHIFTVEALKAYLQHLTPDGVISISRKLLLPPSDSLRLWATAYEALSGIGITSPAKHIAVLRNWDIYTLLITARPMRNTEGLTDFARRLNFDPVFLPGIKKEHANRFNRFKEPFHFQEIGNLAEAYKTGTEKRFFRNYLLDVAPQSDNRPFPGRYLKWLQLKQLYQSMGSRTNALVMSGEIVVAVVFIEALFVSAVLLLLPLRLISKQGQKPGGFKIIFFLAVGAGFMFIELYFIKRYILIFGDPIIGFTVVVSGILIFSGLGGLWAQTRSIHTVRPGILVLIGVLSLTFLMLEFYGDKILAVSDIWKYSVAMLVLLPTGFLMGLPFPLGMQHSLKSPGQRAYAWSVNGCASILAAILSAQLALSIGIPVLLGCAVCAYLVAQAVVIHK